jgi:hypothetical protein
MVMRWLAILPLFVVLTVVAGDKTPVDYPEHGKILAVRTRTTTETRRIRTDTQGRTHGGGSYDVDSFVFSVETLDRTYDLTSDDRGNLQVGDQIDFRILKNAAYVRFGKKERKYEITSVELKQKP